MNANYFAQTQSVALTVFGIFSGVMMRYLHRYKVCPASHQWHPFSHPRKSASPHSRSTHPSPVSMPFVFLGTYSFHNSGVGLMIHSRGARASSFELVMTQILQGFGGGFAAVASQVGAQASVPHVDVAIVTAIVLLWTEIGGAVGGAIGEAFSQAPILRVGKADDGSFVAR